MKKILTGLFFFTVFLAISTLLDSCKDDPEIVDYYRVSIAPPKAPLITKSIKIYKTGSYDSDDIAIKKETKELHKLQESYYKKAVEAKPEQQSFFIDMFKDVRDGKNYLLRVTHKESNELDEFIKIIENGGLEATEIKDYCSLNGIEYAIFVLEQLKYDDFLQSDDPNPLIGTYYCERSRDYYIFKPDETGTFITSGQNVSFKWKQKETNVKIYFEHLDPVNLKFNEKAKTLEESSKEAMEIFGTKLLFRKQ